MNENDVAKVIVDACYRIHVRLGPGLFESVYERILQYEIERQGLLVERQHPVTIQYDELTIPDGFRADLIIEKNVIVEVKALEALAPVHKKQLVTYLKLSGLKLGLLVNFGVPLIKDGIIRVANGI